MTVTATLLAGIPVEQPTLYHRVRFAVGDPAGWMVIESPEGQQSLFVVRDIEVTRAKQVVKVDRVAAPAEFAPPGGLSSDRATATAQAIAQALLQHKVSHVRIDRSLPYIFAHHLLAAGLVLDYSPDLGVLQRRAKDPQELEWLAAAQKTTEQAMEMACHRIAAAKTDRDGTLYDEEGPLTSERLKAEIAQFLVRKNYGVHHGSIVATTPDSADCHDSGSGVLRTGQPVIVDIFPRNEATRYHGDCTRTVVHGQPSDMVLRMHQAVAKAKNAAIAKMQPGATAESIHQTATDELVRAGFRVARGQVTDDPTVQHGTGHGIGLEIHEPILLDQGGGEMLEGEVFTVEPGLYGRRDGGVRMEDMVVVTRDGPINFNHLPDGLDWKI